MSADNTGLVIADTTSGAEALAKKVPGAEVVAAFSTVPSEVLFGVFEVRGQATRRTLVYGGDSLTGKDLPAQLVRDAGFDPVDAAPCASRDIPNRLPARRSARVRRNRRPGTGVSVRATREIRRIRGIPCPYSRTRGRLGRASTSSSDRPARPSLESDSS